MRSNLTLGLFVLTLAMSATFVSGCSDESRVHDACSRTCQRVADCTSDSGLQDCLKNCDDWDVSGVSTQCADDAQQLAQCVEENSCLDALSKCASRFVVVTDVCGDDLSK